MTQEELLRIAVIGSREFSDYCRMKSVLDCFINIHKDKEILIISGGAKGADTLAEKYANEAGIPIKIYPAEWDRYGRSAGFIRNTEMAKNADKVIAFWNGESKGTAHMLEASTKEGVLPYIVNFSAKNGA